MGLEMLGMIPGIGDLADLVNAGIYLFEGKPKKALEAGICALPLVGEVAGVTVLAKADKAAKYVGNITKAVGYSATFTWAAEGDCDNIANIYHNARSGNLFSWILVIH